MWEGDWKWGLLVDGLFVNVAHSAKIIGSKLRIYSGQEINRGYKAERSKWCHEKDTKIQYRHHQIRFHSLGVNIIRIMRWLLWMLQTVPTHFPTSGFGRILETFPCKVLPASMLFSDNSKVSTTYNRPWTSSGAGKLCVASFSFGKTVAKQVSNNNLSATWCLRIAARLNYLPSYLIIKTAMSDFPSDADD